MKETNLCGGCFVEGKHLALLPQFPRCISLSRQSFPTVHPSSVFPQDARNKQRKFAFLHLETREKQGQFRPRRKLLFWLTRQKTEKRRKNVSFSVYCSLPPPFCLLSLSLSLLFLFAEMSEIRAPPLPPPLLPAAVFGSKVFCLNSVGEVAQGSFHFDGDHMEGSRRCLFATITKMYNLYRRALF